MWKSWKSVLVYLFLGQATTDVLRVATKARSRALGPFHPSFQITKILRDGLLYILPDNAHEICDSRLHISLTRISDGKNVVVNRYSSKDELMQVEWTAWSLHFYLYNKPVIYSALWIDSYRTGGSRIATQYKMVNVLATCINLVFFTLFNWNFDFFQHH